MISSIISRQKSNEWSSHKSHSTRSNHYFLRSKMSFCLRARREMNAWIMKSLPKSICWYRDANWEGKRTNKWLIIFKVSPLLLSSFKFILIISLFFRWVHSIKIQTTIAEITEFVSIYKHSWIILEHVSKHWQTSAAKKMTNAINLLTKIQRFKKFSSYN